MAAQVDPLVAPSELSQYGVPGGFLAQFIPRALEIQISAGGALGVMEFVYRLRGDDEFRPTPIVTSAAPPWSVTIDAESNTFATLTWASATYVLNSVYVVDEVGTVTQTAGSEGGLTAYRFDLRTTACSAVTAEAMLLMRNAVKPPLVSWGADVRSHAAAMVYAWLKRSRGLTANQAGSGDENIFSAESLARAYFLGIGEGGKPDNMVDSSAQSDGPMFNAYPTGNTPRGWADGW